jgi:hypothetical protein
MDLWVTPIKIKEGEEIKHFYIHIWYYKTQKNRLVKEAVILHRTTPVINEAMALLRRILPS